MSPGLALAAMLALLCLNAVLVAAQFAIVSARPISPDSPKRPANRRSKLLDQLTADLDHYVAALRLAITATTLAFGAVATPTIAGALTEALAVFAGVSSPVVWPITLLAGFILSISLVVILGELTPKLIGLHRSERVALSTAPLVTAIGDAAAPILRATTRVASFILKMTGIEAKKREHDSGEPGELRAFLAELSALGRIPAGKRAMLENVFEFSEHSARQVMISRDQIEFLSLNRDLEENLALVKRSSHTRYPLCESELDAVVAMVHIKDLFQRAEEIRSSQDLRLIQRDMLFVPESQPIDELQRLFQKRRAHMAIVVDEYGVPTGLVTMEDVLEELVGEIRDEFDTDESPKILEVDDGLLVDGMLLVEDLCRELDCSVDDVDADTVGGYATSVLGRIPRRGDRFRIAEYAGEVVEMQGRRVARVTLQLAADDSASSSLPDSAAGG